MLGCVVNGTKVGRQLSERSFASPVTLTKESLTIVNGGCSKEKVPEFVAARQSSGEAAHTYRR